MPDNVTIRIVGDASGVAPAVNVAGDSIGRLEPILAELTQQMATLTATMREGFESGAASSQRLTAGLNQARVATEAESNALTGMVLKVHEGAESIRTFQMRAKEFAEVYVAMFAVEQISEFINKMAEAAEKVKHLSETFGLSVVQVQQLQGIAKATGVSVDVLTRGMQMLDRGMANAAMGSKNVKQAMDAVGISMNDGRTQMEKLEAVADKFANMADGPKKVALAMQLFGRSGAQLIPILNMGSQGLEQLNKKMEEYGVINDAAAEKGIALAENVNESKLALDGLYNTMTEALAPAFIQLVQSVNSTIQAFIESYREGGTAKEVFEAVSGTIQVAITAFGAFGQILGEIAKDFGDLCRELQSDSSTTFRQKLPKDIDYTKQAFDTLKNLIVLVKDVIDIFVTETGEALHELAARVEADGEIIEAALTGHWGDIKAIWNRSLDEMAAHADATKNRVIGDAEEMWNAFQGNKTWKDLPNVPLGSDSLNGGIPTPKGGGDSFDYNPKGGGKEKKPKDDLVQKLDEELETKITAWNKEQVAQDQAQAYSLQSIADFWDKALQRTGLSVKDKLEIQKKYNAAETAAQKEAEDEKLDLIRKEVEADGANYLAKLKHLRAYAAEVSRFNGAKSKEARAAEDAVTKAETEAHQQRMKLLQEEEQAQKDIALSRIDRAEKDAQLDVELGLKSKQQLLTAERQFENQRYDIERQWLVKRMELAAKDPTANPNLVRQLQLQIEALERQHQNKLTDIDRQAILQRTQLERNAIHQVAQGWAQNIAQLATLQQGFAATWKGILQTIQQTFASVIESMLEKFIAAELLKLIYGKATAQSTIAGEAAKAGAGGVASMAAAPFPMDLTAPAFGASMSAAAMAFSGLNIAERGDWKVNEGLYMLHHNEMVLPAWAASPLRDMISGGGPANFNAPHPSNDSRRRGGDGAPQLHLHGQIIHNPRQLERWFKDNCKAVGAGGKQFARFGGVSNA